MMSQAEDFRPRPIDEEPLLTNRFSIHLPEKLETPSYRVQSVSAMVFDFTKGAWNDISISILDTVSDPDAFIRFMNYFYSSKKEPINIEYVDGPGVAVYHATIDAYEVLKITRPDLSYGDDGLHKTTLVLRPKSISIGYGDQKVTYSSKEKRKLFGLW